MKLSQLFKNSSDVASGFRCRAHVLVFRYALILIAFLASYTARAGVLVGDQEVAGWDWDQYCITVISWSPPEGPGVFIWDDFYADIGPSGGSNYNWYAYVYNDSTEGATDWGSPYVAQRSRSAKVDYNYFYNADPVYGGGLLSGGASVNILQWLRYEGVNQGVYLQLDADTVLHSITVSNTGVSYEYLQLQNVLLDVESGEDPTCIGSTNNMTNIVWSPSQQTNSSASSYALVQVIPITIAFIGTNQPVVNLAPLPGCSGGGYFTSPLNAPSEAIVSNAVVYFNNNLATLDNVSSYVATNYSYSPSGGPTSPNRSIVWYGSYASLLNSYARGFDNTSVSRDYSDLSNYLAYTNGDVIGQLVTYQVLPFHPAYDASIFGTLGDASISDYAYQVAMQLGPVMAVQPIYSGSNSTYSPPVVTAPTNTGPTTGPIVPPSGPVPPGAPIIIPTGGTTTISGISITDSALTGDIQATITAQNGTLTLGTTNGLDGISGFGTSSLVIQGPLTDVNAALASLIYQPNSGFVGNDIMQIAISDLGNNGGGTPELTTATIEIIVTPALSNGTFVSGTNFQFTITGVNGPNWQVYASADLSNWVSLGYLCASNGYGSFTDTNAGNYTNRFYQLMQDSMCSQAIGFINVTAVASGESMIADQLINPGGNTLPLIMPNPPYGTEVYKWDVVGQGWNNIDLYSERSGSWSDTNMTLNPGEGLLLYNPSSNSVTFTFIGNVPLGPQSQTVWPNTSVMSSIVPFAVETDALGFSPVNGDTIYRWDPVGQGWNYVYEYTTRGGWSASFVPNFGESFLFLSGASTNRTWTENFSIAP